MLLCFDTFALFACLYQQKNIRPQTQLQYQLLRESFVFCLCEVAVEIA